MKERPIIFSAPMVRAILDGRKTQTRREVKIGGHRIARDFTDVSYCPDLDCKNAADRKAGWIKLRDCPYGKVGDRLWVREAFMYVDNLCTIRFRADNAEETFFTAVTHSQIYRVNFELQDPFGKWKPSIHMPRWASRIELEITGIRIERLKAITEVDAKAEGVGMKLIEPSGEDGYIDYIDGETFLNPKSSFESLWQKINGKESLDFNPWVWVIEFERKEAGE